MTFEELKTRKKWLKGRIRVLEMRCSDLTEDYIKEHQPDWFKKYQWLTIRLRVTQMHHDSLTERYQNMKKWQVGNEYTVTGCCHGFAIGNDGELRPDLWRVDYSWKDEIVSIEPAKWQPQGCCGKCLRFKDGLCYRTGGMEYGEKYATQEIAEDHLPCPEYQEKVVMYDRCGVPTNFTIVRTPKETKYRNYEQGWRYFTEWSERTILQNYTFEPSKKEHEKGTEETEE